MAVHCPKPQKHRNASPSMSNSNIASSASSVQAGLVPSVLTDHPSSLSFKSHALESVLKPGVGLGN
ncbi:hypothetical protein M404DRAFT_36482 [Pisolithus tinctorius Marx 270]|uniref:Uncharacterized protein n=1 Tax=Pisolithus tinctorius Marx 270 TaxID=870435 RepID=A0A0C3MVR7_PISTI|nr:hypothetical protein M404DRAFT_36482 [Pisolithus tinctorius Marx 270]